jgi:hypothetical protein
MTSRQRLITALDGGQPDRLPATTHHLMPYFLDTYLKGASQQAFFDRFGLDAIQWILPLRPDTARGEYHYPGLSDDPSGGESWICSDNWRIERTALPDDKHETTRYDFVTPATTLSMTLQWSSQTTWVTERLIKEKRDIDAIARWAPMPICDITETNQQAAGFGERGITRGMVPGFEVYGQPGCWQDAAVLVGIERLILETYDDPQWVHALLAILRDRKRACLRSMKGARFDILELGGGDASSTVISPSIFDTFVAPYDCELIGAAHEAGQRVVYHTCGGMMPLLERIAAMNPDAMETFTPPSLGGDADLSEAKSRIGDRVCLIGGFDQCRYFQGCTPAETRAAVRRCFAQAGKGGGYILAPSDHFFDADPALIMAFAEEARACSY